MYKRWLYAVIWTLKRNLIPFETPFGKWNFQSAYEGVWKYSSVKIKWLFKNSRPLWIFVFLTVRFRRRPWKTDLVSPHIGAIDCINCFVSFMDNTTKFQVPRSCGVLAVVDTYESISKMFRTDDVKIVKIINKRVGNCPRPPSYMQLGTLAHYKW
jgi:hypothetical protein